MLANEHGKIPGSQIRCRLMISISIFPETKTRETLGNYPKTSSPLKNFGLGKRNFGHGANFGSRDLFERREGNGVIKQMIQNAPSLGFGFLSHSLSLSLSPQKSRRKKTKNDGKLFFSREQKILTASPEFFEHQFSPDSRKGELEHLGHVMCA